MSNLVEIAKDLEYVPDEQLIQLANGSDPRFPPFVVISEIKRRTDMRNRASEPMPRTTVAQEMVQEFAMPSRQGLEGMSQDATGILPPTVYNRDMPSSMMADGGLVGYADKGQTETTGSKIKRFLTAPIRAISDLGRLQYEASEDARKRLKEKISTNADRRNDLITKSLPVIKGEKTLQEFREEMEELFNSDFIKDDKNYRNQIRNYYFQFEKEFLPRFQKEIAETGQMPKDVIGHYNKYENFRNSNRYLNPFDTGYERPDLSLPEEMQKKQEGGLTGYQTGNQTALTNTFIYGNNYANNLQDYLDMKRRTSTMDQREQALFGSDNLSYPMLNTTPDFNIDMSGISALQTTQEDLDAQLQIDSNMKSFDYLSKQLEEAKENLKRQKEIGDRGGLGGGTSYIEQAQARVDRIEKMLRPKQNQKDFVADAQAGLKKSVMQEEELLAQALKQKQEDDAKNLADEKTKKEKELFANMDLNIPERTQTPRTEAQMKQQLNADVLMTVGTAIGSSTTPSEIFEKLSGLPSQLAATRKEQREEVKDFEDTRRADALAKLNIQIALKKLDQATEQAKLKGDANDIAAINAIADVLSGTLDTDSSRYKAAERALDRIILKLSGNEADTKGIAALSELLIPAES